MAEHHKKFPVEEDIPPRKILFLGDERVGKTTFIRRFCEHMIDFHRCDNYQGVFLGFSQFVLYLTRGERRIPFRFLDLPAGTTAESRSGQYPEKVDLVVLCYAVDDLGSFTSIWERWIPEFRMHYPIVRCYLLGLKCDMRLEMFAANRSPVTDDRARLVHQRHGFDGDYLECSVEGNPERARHCMDILINDVFMYE